MKKHKHKISRDETTTIRTMCRDWTRELRQLDADVKTMIQLLQDVDRLLAECREMGLLK